MRRCNLIVATALCSVTAYFSSAQAADLILNEYNAVEDDRCLGASGPGGGCPTGGPEDPFWGRRSGNGGDWIELVVITDHLDVRGWEILVVNDAGGLSEESFSIRLSDHEIWSDLRSGTIVTVSENRGNNVGDYHPEVGQWWLNVRASPSTSGIFTTVSCVAPPCAPENVNWKVSNSNTQITIKDAFGAVVFGPAGEGIQPTGGVGSDEVFKLEQDPSASITPTSLYNDGVTSTFGRPNAWNGGASVQDFSALRSVVPYTPLAEVRVNEVASHSDPGLDWVELRNMTDQPVDIGGWFLSDSFKQLTEHTIPPGTVIPARGSLVIDESVLGFAFSAPCGDEVILSEGDGVAPTGPRDFLQFGPMDNGVTYGRWTDGEETTARLSDATPGSGNAPPLTGPIVINEIMYHPADPAPPSSLNAEFIELRNITKESVTLSTNFGASGTFPWQITGGVDFVFPLTTTIPPSGFLVVVGFDPVADPGQLAEFRAFYGIDASVEVIGPYSGKLDNFSDTVRLRKPDTPEPNGDICGGSGGPSPYVPMVIVDELTYFDFGDWPESADGGGASLERIDALQVGTAATNWSANLFAFATPGATNSTVGVPTSAQQKCINGQNKSLAKVVKTHGKDACACLKDASAQRLAPMTVDTCFAADRREKVAKVQGKTETTFSRTCVGTDGVFPKLAFFGPHSPDQVNFAAVEATTNLLRDAFGLPVDPTIVTKSGDPNGSRCQLSVAKRLKRCLDTHLKEFLSCKKASLKRGEIREAIDLASCLGEDPRGKIDGACGATGALREEFDRRCGATTSGLDALFPACGSSDVEVIHSCLEQAAACRACIAVVRADALAADCDLVDDGVDNESCPK